MATIDVLLPVKNGVDFLAESLDSLKAQSFKDWRVLVLDHGSDDGSAEMAARYHEADPRIELHSFPEADGLSGLLNKGLEISDCRYVMRHDADDVCYPERMALSLAAFEQDRQCVAIGGQADVINAAGAPIGDMSMPIGRLRVGAASLFRNPIAHPTAMLEFAQVQKAGIRYGSDFMGVFAPEQQMVVKNLAEDYFLFGQLAVQGKCNNVPHKLIKYRWHGNNVSARRFDDQMKVSLQISRYLSRAFAQMKQQPYFDPAPFCNHGGILFELEGRSDFSAEFERMAASVRAGFEGSPEVERELRFRKIADTRNSALLLWRYFLFQSREVPETGEWNAIRSWLIRRLPGKRRMSVLPEGVPA
ncbi:glycosyltransferase family 2 protein [Herbaspirillum huttiense]|uniref:glycosyltransferase family A protein n=1 Tax=Herbaspirillum huttiense TaxID=863372 RepID=UPI0010654640|nr:glycosyltransferase family A protein [Herbaspirillum huttiense]QBP75427.1 glycosyltransferase family 2 protein [Herbaspirillum huttiense]